MYEFAIKTQSKLLVVAVTDHIATFCIPLSVEASSGTMGDFLYFLNKLYEYGTFTMAPLWALPEVVDEAVRRGLHNDEALGIVWRHGNESFRRDLRAALKRHGLTKHGVPKTIKGNGDCARVGQEAKGAKRMVMQ